MKSMSSSVTYSDRHQVLEGTRGCAVYSLNADGLIATWDREAATVTHYAAREVVGRHYASLHTSEDVAADIPGHALASARHYGHFDSEGWRLRKDGSHFRARIDLSAIHDRSGAVVGFTEILKDITARHRQQQSLRDSDRRYRQLVQSVTDYALYMLDLDGTVTNWNAGAELAKGYSEREIVGANFSCFYTQDDRDAGLPAKNLQIAYRTGRFEAQGWRVRKDGSRLWAHVVIDLIRDDDGEPIGFAKITKDRTLERQAVEATLESERRFRHLVQGVTDYAIYMLDPHGIISNWNPGAERIKGYRANEIIGQHFSCFFSAEDQVRGLPQAALATARAKGSFEAEGWRVRKDGTRFWAHAFIDLIHDEDGRLIGFAKITRDVTRQKADSDRILEVTRVLDIALSHMKQGLCVFDAQKKLQLANRRFMEMFGQEHQDRLVGLSFTDIVRTVIFQPSMNGEEHHGSDADFHARHAGLINSSSMASVIECLPDGTVMSIAHSPISDGAWISTFEDVTLQARDDAIIARLARQDSLTGLANRHAFMQRLTALVSYRPPAASCAVLFIDLDDFKSLNDTHGHAAGDVALRHVADRMRTCTRASDTTARLGGDEFAILLEDCTEAQTIAVAERLIDDIRRPFIRDDQAFSRIGLSIGYVMISADHETPDAVLADADLALYEAKAAGKCVWRACSPTLRLRASAQRDLEVSLSRSVEAGSGFMLHYQPIKDIATGSITSRESLIRWQHPRLGLMRPDAFIPLAEQIGLIGRLGNWVLHQSCREALLWEGDERVAINVSPLQLGTADFTNQVEEALRVSGLPAHRLSVEVTETALLEDGSSRIDDLHRLKKLGVRVGLDDFGVGFSSLGHLRAFPFDSIKIDGSFVRDAVTREDCAAIVGAVAELGHRLGMIVVAEGIESEAHLQLARERGCHEAQGYLIGRPAHLTGPSKSIRVAA